MIYRSLISPYLTYGICVWGHASKFFLNKLLILQKRVLRLIHFTPRNEHAIPLFIKSTILPVTMIYFETIANLMHDISHGSQPSKLRPLWAPWRLKVRHWRPAFERESPIWRVRNYRIRRKKLIVWTLKMKFKVFPRCE